MQVDRLFRLVETLAASPGCASLIGLLHPLGEASAQGVKVKRKSSTASK